MIELNYKAIGNIIKSKRKELKMTQKELGELVDLSEGSVSKYESGNVKDATITKLNDFAKVLDIDITELLGIQHDKSNNNNSIDTIAAHFKGKNISKEKLKRIEKFIEFTLNEDE